MGRADLVAMYVTGMRMSALVNRAKYMGDMTKLRYLEVSIGELVELVSRKFSPSGEGGTIPMLTLNFVAILSM
jgi:hypothetical protein